MQDGNPGTAYALVSDTGLDSGNEFSEAEFLAGWIALRFLKDPQAALPHFKKLADAVSRPISLARAHYWQGRAYEARRRCGLGLAAIPRRVQGSPTRSTASSRWPASTPRRCCMSQNGRRRRARARRLRARRAGPRHARAGRSRRAEYPARLRAALSGASIPTPGTSSYWRRSAGGHGLRAMSRCAWRRPRATTMLAAGAVRLSRDPHSRLFAGPARRRNRRWCSASSARKPNSIPMSVSGAGARGIMQIMPSSARHNSQRWPTCAYRPNDLMSDTDYNMQLGMTELAGYLADWARFADPGGGGVQCRAQQCRRNGSPPMAIRAARTSIRSTGSNRSRSTRRRNYVQRVVENMEIYRNRLAGRDQPLRILADLYGAERAAPKCWITRRRLRRRTGPGPTPKPGAHSFSERINLSGRSRAIPAPAVAPRRSATAPFRGKSARARSWLLAAAAAPPD